MKSVMIRLSLVENVNKFVNIVSRYPFEMDLRAGRHVVDAKSILGIFSLDLSKPIALEIYRDSRSLLLWQAFFFVSELAKKPNFRRENAFNHSDFVVKYRIGGMAPKHPPDRRDQGDMKHGQDPPE